MDIFKINHDDDDDDDDEYCETNINTHLFSLVQRCKPDTWINSTLFPLLMNIGLVDHTNSDLFRSNYIESHRLVTCTSAIGREHH